MTPHCHESRPKRGSLPSCSCRSCRRSISPACASAQTRVSNQERKKKIPINTRTRCCVTYLQRIFPGEGLVAPIARVWLHGPVYPLVPLQVVVPRKRRRTLVALVRLLRRPLLRLEYHAAEVAAIPAHTSLRIVRHERHGPARVRQVVHVLRRLGRCLLVARILREAAWASGPSRLGRGRLVSSVLGVVVVLVLLWSTRGAPKR